MKVCYHGTGAAQIIDGRYASADILTIQSFYVVIGIVDDSTKTSIRFNNQRQHGTDIMRKRKSLEHYEERYHTVTGEREPLYWRCIYCGLPADTRDHVPPISRVSDYEAFNLAFEVYIKVPCCGECNSLIGADLHETFLERAERVKDKIARKYRRHITNVDWDDEELAELGPTLRSKVLASKRKSEQVTARIEYYGGIDLVIDWIHSRFNVN